MCMIIPVVILSLVFVSFLSSQSSYATNFSSNGVGITPVASAAGAAAGASAGGSSSSSSSSAAASASAGGNTIIRNEQTVINRNVIDSLVRSAEAKAITTSPSSTAPLVD